MDKLQGIKPGDRVRVTFEGVYPGQNRIELDDAEGMKGSSYFAPSEIAAPTFKIERIEPPLAVGDRVRWLLAKYPHIIRNLAEGFAWIHDERWPDAAGTIALISDLERIP